MIILAVVVAIEIIESEHVDKLKENERVHERSVIPSRQQPVEKLIQVLQNGFSR